ncbi:MAG: hypothetical protein JW739_05805 [Opitutales bacterium]|nr:hypothetical protein [Opitutales bacterium]
MLTLKIQLSGEDVDRLESLDDAIRHSLMARIGRSFESHLREHFRVRNMTSNSTSKRGRKGWFQFGIWNQIRQTTAYVGATEKRATISISEPAFRTKLYGSQNMKARRGRYLAIPMNERVYGKMPRGNPVPGLFPVRLHGKLYLGATEGDALTLYYRLARSVTIPADKDALPSDESTQTILSQTVKDFLDKQ